MTWTDARGTTKEWAKRIAIVSTLSLLAFVAKTAESRLNSRVEVLESSHVNEKVTLGRLEEKVDAMKAQLDRIEKRGVR